MPQLTREQVLNNLESDWGTYVEHFRNLSSEAQSAFLAQQGFASFGGLLGHIIAWWKEGQARVKVFTTDPNDHSPDAIDSDIAAFNARAISDFAGMDDTAVIATFEETRRAWAELVKALPADAFQNQRVVERLHLELVEHWEEHQLEDKH